MFDTAWPGEKFRLDAFGRACPFGHTVRKPTADELMAVTFSATEPTPVAGTPPRPAIVRLKSVPPTSFGAPENAPSTVLPPRVSSRRAGVRPLNVPLLGNQPRTSTSTSTLAGDHSEI